MVRVSPILAKNVKRFRSAKGLTQSELADELGVTIQTIFGYESGRQFPRVDAIENLCEALGVRPWQLLADEGEGGSVPPDLVEHIAAAARAAGLKVSLPK